MSDSQDVKKIVDIETPSQEDNVSKETQNILKATDQLLSVMEKLSPKTNKDKIANEEAFIKIIKPLRVDVENTLPELFDFVDNLSYIGDENADVLRSKINKIEEYLPQFIDYIEQYDKEHKKPQA
ncbi:MAG: hypothetical protein Q4E81_05255 [Succinatimonas sp.]|nr:hypothetical protein [Succinatimonas sp.]